jgi:hypothetical protein
MALNPIVFTEKVVRSFLRYQLTAYPLPMNACLCRCGGSSRLMRRAGLPS